MEGSITSQAEGRRRSDGSLADLGNNVDINNGQRIAADRLTYFGNVRKVVEVSIMGTSNQIIDVILYVVLVRIATRFQLGSDLLQTAFNIDGGIQVSATGVSKSPGC